VEDRRSGLNLHNPGNYVFDLVTEPASTRNRTKATHDGVAFAYAQINSLVNNCAVARSTGELGRLFDHLASVGKVNARSAS
jgi:hypothetical protein